LFLLDKNKNDLALLNRRIVQERSTKNIDFICADISEINLNNLLIENKINLYLNFAAIKHVRSEENLYSIKYMFSTNYESFFNINCKSKYLKKIFSISTDKATDPSSFMGISKLMMEHKLKKIMKNELEKIFYGRLNDVSLQNEKINSWANNHKLEWGFEPWKKFTGTNNCIELKIYTRTTLSNMSNINKLCKKSVIYLFS
jgi:hypothetical protein